MSDHSDDDYLTDVDGEDEEEEMPIQKKSTKPITPNSFGNTMLGQNIIGDDADNGDYEDSDEDEEDEFGKVTKSSASSSVKSAKGRKKRNKKVEEENESDFEQEPEVDADADIDVDIAEESDQDSDADNEDEDLNDQDYDEDEDDSDSVEGGEEDSEKYMHHFDKEITKEYILETHPECIPVNMDEVRAMLTVIRNEDGVPIDDFHKTVPIVTKFEKARIIGQRASQLNSGATPYIYVPDAIDGSTIAEIEFNMKKIPVIVKRPLPNGAFEYWRLKDLEILY